MHSVHSRHPRQSQQSSGRTPPYPRYPEYYSQSVPPTDSSSHFYQKHENGRHIPTNDRTHSASSPPPFPRRSSSLVRRLDLFPKVDADHRAAGTAGGGAATLLGAALCLILCASESFTYLRANAEAREHVTVHTRLERELRVSMDVEFPRAVCEKVKVEAVDIGGDASPLDGRLSKKRTPGGGCRLSGEVVVNRVGGLFHFHSSDVGLDEAKESFETDRPTEIGKFDSSHVIHELRYGPDHEMSDGCFPATVWRDAATSAAAAGGGGGGGADTGVFMYFAALVPTIHHGWDVGVGAVAEKKKGGGGPLDSVGCVITEKFVPYMGIPFEETVNDPSDPDAAAKNDTSAKNHHAHRTIPDETVLPGVMFQYELFPFSIEVTRQSVPLTHLLIRLMAIVGGVVTITGWISTLF